MNDEIDRQEQRFEVRQGCGASVTIKRRTGRSPKRIQGQLKDLSSSGAKVTVPYCIPFEEAVRVRIEIPELSLRISVPAEVCWIRSMDDSTWVIGCSLNKELSVDVLDKIAAGGYIDRRRSPWQKTDIRATARWELAETWLPIRIVDISAGGFCFFCEEPKQAGLGTSLLLERPDGTSVTVCGKEVWHKQVKDGFLVGCTLLDRGDFRYLDEIANPVDSQERQA